MEAAIAKIVLTAARENFRPRLLSLLGAALLAATYSAVNAEPVDDVIEELKIREYLRATENECRVAARDHARRQVSVTLGPALAGRESNEVLDARMEKLARTYAREACRLGVEDGIIQGYRATYAKTLSSEDLEAALGFLLSAQGQNFVRAGLAANREVLPMIRRRQEGQVSRASALLQTRLTSLLAEMSRNRAGTEQGGANVQ